MKERLLYAMKKLNVTEKTLGDIINIDKSLINKWKNGKRPFNFNTPYYHTVAEAFARIFEKSPKTLKEDFLANLPDAVKGKDARELFNWFFYDKTISIDNIEKQSLLENSAISFVWNDCSNNYKANNEFFSQISDRQDGNFKAYYAGFNECPNSDKTNENFIQQIIDLLSNNNIVEMLIESFEDNMKINQLLDLINLSFYEKFLLYVKKSKKRPSHIQNYMLYDKSIALEMNSIKAAKGGYYSEIYSDVNRCTFLYNKFKYDIEESVPFVKKVPAKYVTNIVDKMKNYIQNPSMSYTYSGIPIFFSLSENLLNEILDYNGFNKNERIPIIKDCKLLREIYQESVNKSNAREIYCMEQFDSLLEEKEHKMMLLTNITNKNIYASKETFVKILAEWLEFINQNKNVEIMLSPKPMIKISSELSCYIKQYFFSIIWKRDQQFSNNLFADDVYNTELLMEYMNSLWEKGEHFIRDKKIVTDYVNNIIAVIKNG